MNISDANVNELKSYIASLLLRCKAITGHFGLVDFDYDRQERLSTYMRDVAELVEMTRLIQVALSRLIAMDRNSRFVDTGSPELHSDWAEIDNEEPHYLRSRFSGVMHMTSGHVYSLADSFSEETGMGDVLDKEPDYGEVYSRYRPEFAQLHDWALQAQIILARLMRVDNRRPHDS